MGNATILSDITAIIDGALYFSESENPFVVSDWGHITPAELPGKIASLQESGAADLRQIDAAAFFERITKNADPSDTVMQEHTTKLRHLYQYLQEQVTDLRVTRIEGNSRIPVIITGYLPDHTCIAITTLAIET